MAQWEAVQGCVSYRTEESRRMHARSFYSCIVLTSAGVRGSGRQPRPSGLCWAVSLARALLWRSRGSRLLLVQDCDLLTWGNCRRHLLPSPAHRSRPPRGRGEAVPGQDAAPAAARPARPQPIFSPTLLFKNVRSSFVAGDLSQPPEARAREGMWPRVANCGWEPADVMPVSPPCQLPSVLRVLGATRPHVTGAGRGADPPQLSTAAEKRGQDPSALPKGAEDEHWRSSWCRRLGCSAGRGVQAGLRGGDARLG